MDKANHVLRSLGALIVTFASFAAAGCDIQPYDGTLYSTENTDRTIEFEGYSTRQSGLVRLQARNQSTNQWETFSYTVSRSESSVVAGYWDGSPALYAWSTEAQIVSDASTVGSQTPLPRFGFKSGTAIAGRASMSTEA